MSIDQTIDVSTPETAAANDVPVVKKPLSIWEDPTLTDEMRREFVRDLVRQLPDD